jgi:hypothetical protein
MGEAGFFDRSDRSDRWGPLAVVYLTYGMHVHGEACVVTQSNRAWARSSSGKLLGALNPIVLTSQYAEDMFVKL